MEGEFIMAKSQAEGTKDILGEVLKSIDAVLGEFGEMPGNWISCHDVAICERARRMVEKYHFPERRSKLRP